MAPTAKTGTWMLFKAQDPPRMLLRRPSEAAEVSQQEAAVPLEQESTPELRTPASPLI